MFGGMDQTGRTNLEETGQPPRCVSPDACPIPLCGGLTWPDLRLEVRGPPALCRIGQADHKKWECFTGRV